jgi:type III secretory pathway component EscV
LAADLPGNQPGRIALSLSPAFEGEVGRWVRTIDGRTSLAMPRETAQTLLAAFAAHGGEADRVVLVRDARLRPFVRSLLAAHFPALPVLSWPERARNSQPPGLEVELDSAPAKPSAVAAV